MGRKKNKVKTAPVSQTPQSDETVEKPLADLNSETNLASPESENNEELSSELMAAPKKRNRRGKNSKMKKKASQQNVEKETGDDNTEVVMKTDEWVHVDQQSNLDSPKQNQVEKCSDDMNEIDKSIHEFENAIDQAVNEQVDLQTNNNQNDESCGEDDHENKTIECETATEDDQDDEETEDQDEKVYLLSGQKIHPPEVEEDPSDSEGSNDGNGEEEKEGSTGFLTRTQLSHVTRRNSIKADKKSSESMDSSSLQSQSSSSSSSSSSSGSSGSWPASTTSDEYSADGSGAFESSQSDFKSTEALGDRSDDEIYSQDQYDSDEDSDDDDNEDSNTPINYSAEERRERYSIALIVIKKLMDENAIRKHHGCGLKELLLIDDRSVMEPIDDYLKTQDLAILFSSLKTLGLNCASLA